MSERSPRCPVVVSFDFDAEEVWIGEDAGNVDRPGRLSQGTYGAKVAVPLVLELLHRLGVPATFFVPGRVAERHPGRVEDILGAGHEIGHHGYTHTSPATLDLDAERVELVRGLEVLNRLGADVVGYRAPAWEFSSSTLDLLVEHGMWYSSNLMDDIRPYRHPHHDLVELPVHWTLDDAPHFWFDLRAWDKTIRTAAEVEALWREEIAGIHELGGLVMLTLHPQVIGRPGRLAMLERLLRWIAQLPGTDFSTARDVAATVRR
jgi:peptidoglycan-N-acetylglucosamine deacetylase